MITKKYKIEDIEIKISNEEIKQILRSFDKDIFKSLEYSFENHHLHLYK